MTVPAPAVFLDRDGTLNEDRGYIWLRSQFAWLPGVPRTLAALKEAGYRLVIVTNQAGIAKGLYSSDDVRRLHRDIQKDLARWNVQADGFYFCPHHPDFTGPCRCRKPAPGMILEAQKDLNLDLERSYLIGDKISDIECGLAAGVRTFMVMTGYGRSEEHLAPPEVRRAADLAEAGELILKNRSR
jgi:D-glycero-D-manno-heptose 1,7-bisphosphate phosphatase